MSKKEQVSKFQIWVTVVGFLGLLFVPSIAWVFCHNAIGDDTSENRRLAEMPEFGLGKISAFPKKFEGFYNDHAPFRKIIRTSWTNINFFGIGDSPSEWVLLGKTDENDNKKRWLFYTNDSDGNTVKDVQGINPLTNSDKKSALHYMKAYTDAMKKKGIDLYYFIPPDKASVYTEFLPEGISIYDKTRAEDFEDYINKHGGLKNAIFAKQELSSAKERYGDKLYYKQDTHWNYLGSFFGFKALMNVAEPTYKNFDIEVDFEYGKVLTQDLASMMNVRSYFVDDVPVVGYLQGKTFERKTIKAKEDVIAITSNPNSAIKKTVLIVGDSFRNAMIPYFAKVYSKVIAMKRTDYRHGMMTEYDPDIVIFEVLERYIKATKGFDF